MVDMCREKKTIIAEECRQNDEKRGCELVLNAVFYWEPVEFFQKRCDMITLRFFFQGEPCGVDLDILYARDLFIGYSYESSIAVVQS